MNINARLAQAGIPLVAHEGGITLASLISPLAMGAPPVLLPQSGSPKIVTRVGLLAPHLGLPAGLPVGLAVSLPLASRKTVTDVFSSALRSNGSVELLLPVAACLKLTGLRSDFRRLVTGSTNVALSAMSALSAIGLEPEDHAVITRSVNHEEVCIGYFALAVLAENGALTEVLESGQLDERLDADAGLAALVELATTGGVEGFADALGDMSGWKERFTYLRCARAAAGLRANPELCAEPAK